MRRLTMVVMAAALSACASDSEDDVVPPTTPSNSGVVFDSLPATLPPSVTSENLQANRIDEFGELVTLSSTTAVSAASATVVLVTYGGYAPGELTPDGVTSTVFQPVPAYSWPITINLFDPASLVTLATRTQTFNIPARPPADPSCSNYQWLSSEGCKAGYAFTVTFDLSGATLPSSFVYGITYDTQSAGQHPTGNVVHSNKLNVGLFTYSVTPTVGSFTGVTATGTIYLNGQNSFPYKGTGTPGSFGPDTNWPYHLGVRFNKVE